VNATASATAALGGAISFAVAAVLQQEAAQQTTLDTSLKPRLLLQLLRRPKWVLGVTMLLVGFGLQGLALANGPVALVQPIIATELAFAIPLAVWRRHRRAHKREWIGIVSVLAGVTAFLLASSPVAGTRQPAGLDWLLILTPVGAVIAISVGVAATVLGPLRATFLGMAAGLSFGLLAVLTKAVTYQLSSGLSAVLGGWQLYVLILLGISALVVSQSAYQAGPLALSMPAVALLEPVVAVVAGEIVFHEQAQLAGAALAVEAGAALVAVLGIATLATSPTVLSVYEQAPSPTETTTGEVDSRTFSLGT
jgi:drug/metabolite transporter (DMT)-like permease